MVSRLSIPRIQKLFAWQLRDCIGKHGGAVKNLANCQYWREMAIFLFCGKHRARQAPEDKFIPKADILFGEKQRYQTAQLASSGRRPLEFRQKTDFNSNQIVQDQPSSKSSRAAEMRAPYQQKWQLGSSGVLVFPVCRPNLVCVARLRGKQSHPSIRPWDELAENDASKSCPRPVWQQSDLLHCWEWDAWANYSNRAWIKRQA